MTDFVRILTRKNSLRKHCQELSIQDLSKIIEDLTQILDEHKAVEKKRSEAELVKTQKIEAIRQAMADSGIDFEDLKDLVPVVSKKKVQAKYRVVVNDVAHEWSGRGRTPVIFQQYFDDNNVTKENCLIK
jgi:DNA-binding protein H-NS